MDLQCCRICLKRHDLIPISEIKFEIENDCKTFSEIFQIISGVKMDHSCILPQFSCSQCSKELLSSYNLRLQIIETDTYLKTVLEELSKKKIYSDESFIYEDEFCKDSPDIISELSEVRLFDELLEHDTQTEMCQDRTIPNNSEMCKICNKIIQKDFLQNHLDAHKENPFLCKDCKPPRMFKNQIKYKKHVIAMHNPKNMKCYNCLRSFSSLKKLEAHLDQMVMGMCKKNLNSDNRKCYICEMEFETISNKWKHVEKEHANVEKKCPHCQFQTKSIRSFDIHLRHHRCGVDYACDICGKELRRRADLQLHWKTQHSDDHVPQQRFICDLCGKTFRQRVHMVRHLNSLHLKIKKFKCDRCPDDRKFTTQGALTQHKIDHHDFPPPYKCLDCNQGFAFQSQLNQHRKLKKPGQQCEKKILKTRRSQEPPMCDICKPSKYFKTYSGLRKHQSSFHQNWKPFECDLCGKSFTQKPVLEIHRRIHTGEKKFMCSLCKRKFTDPSSFYKHTKSVHPDAFNARKKSISQKRKNSE